MLNRIIKFFLENRLVTYIILIALVAWGLAVAPFSWNLPLIPRNPVPVDAIPNLGENQQIVYTEWPGKSPQDVEDQITYPLTTALLGVPGVKTIRSSSIFGMSSIYVIFDEDVDFYWSRSRILEKLNALPPGTLPADVKPALGPDATALGQVYWYTLEGRNPKTGKPTGGWDPQELRSLQDFYVRYGLLSVPGVSEVASVGGYVKEYQVEMDPAAMQQYDVSVAQVMKAVKQSNEDIGARTLEFNKAEYLVRAKGYIKSLDDLRQSVVKMKDNTPILLKDVATIQYGPATRRGGLDKAGAEAVGGVVVTRFDANPMQVIQKVKAKIKDLSAGLPSKTLADGSQSKVTVVPFYDRSGLIQETLGTLQTALSHEILISIIVVLVLVFNLRASALISSILPVGVLMTFIAMKYFGIPANVVALSGIAIAIGVMVDVGIVFTENTVRHLEMPENKGAKGPKLLKLVYESTTEVASAIVTALATTIVSFLPVFFLQAAEGKLFRPLAFTKTFALVAAFVLGILVVPTLTYLIFGWKAPKKKVQLALNGLLVLGGLFFLIFWQSWGGLVLLAFGLNNLVPEWKEAWKRYQPKLTVAIALLTVAFFLTHEWMPLGVENNVIINFLFVAVLMAIILGILMGVVHFYPAILGWCLRHKKSFLAIPITVILLGLLIWQGFGKIFSFIPAATHTIGWKIEKSSFWTAATEAFPGVGKEFMPTLDEGAFLLMPSTMPHTGVEENIATIRMVDKRVQSIPEVASVVGKWGRVNSALDPAPTSMFENIINYTPEYKVNAKGTRLRFATDADGSFKLKDGSLYNPKDSFAVIKNAQLIPDANGQYFRQWRPEIQSPDDIWEEIVAATRDIPGLTSAPKLQPIQTRLIMLQTGMRAPMGLKIFGPDLKSIEKTGYALEDYLKQVPGIAPKSVFADRIVGKPYLEINLDRRALARYGLTVETVQNYIAGALGGMPMTTTVEGRERYKVRIRYAREYRDNPDAIRHIMVTDPTGAQIPLGQLAKIEYRRGPQMIKSENTFLVGYVIFDKLPQFAEVDVVQNAQKFLKQKLQSGEWSLPKGVSYQFTGNYENEVRATKRLMLVVPLSLLVIFLILYFQFRSVSVSFMIYSGILVAFAGGFLMLGLYGQSWFLNFSVAGINMRDLFQMHTINLSVAVWVGFIALFGIATDDGVIMGTYLGQRFEQNHPTTVDGIRETVLSAGKMRVRAAMMTAACAIIALIPVLSSTGKGSDIMVPMAIPVFGGMIIQLMTMFVVPTLYCWWKEGQLKKQKK